MNIVYVALFCFGLFAISRAYLGYKSHHMILAELLFWVGVWLAIIFSPLFPEISTIVTYRIGISRGVDAAFFLAFILLFYLVFRLYIKIDALDKDVTRLVIESAKKHSQ